MGDFADLDTSAAKPSILHESSRGDENIRCRDLTSLPLDF
jgi:hypothetical protein